MNHESISVSVIIPTRNRPRDLELTIRTVFWQTLLPQELIIVDQSVDDEGRQRIERLYAAAPEALRCHVRIRYIHNTGISGGAQARNVGMQVAENSIWLFLDDDVVLEPSFLEELVAPYAQDPEVVGVSGIITNYSRPSLVTRIWRAVFMRGPFYDTRQLVYWNAANLRESAPIEVDRFGGGLMSFRASAVRNCRFDENLSGVSDGEDVDFCSRLGAVKLLISPRARLVHNQSPRGRLQDHPLRRQVRAECFLYWKNWSNGLRARLCYLWLQTGYVLIAAVASLRRFSLAPWRALRLGKQEARTVLAGRPQNCESQPESLTQGDGTHEHTDCSRHHC